MTLALRIGTIGFLMLPLTAFAERPQARPFEIRKIKSVCRELLEASAPARPPMTNWEEELLEMKAQTPKKKVSLIPEHSLPDALALPAISSLSAETYGLRGFNRAAFEGLLATLRSPELSLRFLNHLTRVGLVRAENKDPIYAKFKLLAENKNLNVLEPSADPIVQSYLKKFRKTALAGKIDPELNPVSPRLRLHILITMVAQSFEKLDPSKVDSIEVLKTVFMEVNRLKIDKKLDAENFDFTWAALSGFAKFKIADLAVPEYVTFFSGFVPILGPLNSAISIWNAVNRNVSKAKLIKDQFIEVTSAQPWQRMTPKTLEIVYSRRDIYDLKPKAIALIKKYADRRSALFSPEFANEFVAAYPELTLLFNRESTDNKITSPFGEWPAEVQQVFYRSAFLIALYKNDSKPFSKLSRAEFADLRYRTFSNLGLLDDGVITEEEIDLLMTFFVTDILGRANSPLIDAVEEDFNVSKIVGNYDFERRSAFLLKRYTLLSYSFARQKNVDQQLILSLLDGVFTFNLEHILRLDASAASFETLKQLDKRTLNFLFYRNLLSFAGHGSSSELGSYSQRLTSEQLQLWMKLKALLDKAVDGSMAGVSIYDNYLQWVSEFYGMPIETKDDQAVLKLSAIAGMNRIQASALRRRFDALTATDRAMLTKYLTGKSVLIYGGREVFEACSENGGNFSERIDRWLGILTKVYRALDFNPAVRSRIGTGDASDARLFVEPVVDLIQRNDAEQLAKARFWAEQFKFGYVINVSI